MEVGKDWGRNCLQALNYSVYEELMFVLHKNCKCSTLVSCMDLHLASCIA